MILDLGVFEEMLSIKWGGKLDKTLGQDPQKIKAILIKLNLRLQFIVSKEDNALL